MAPSPRRGSSKVAAVWLGLALACAATASAGGPEVAPKGGQPQETHATDGANDECRARAIRAVQTRYEGIRDLRARFEQTARPASVGGRGSTETRSKGSVVVAKPSRMRWTYESPEPSVVVSDGKTLWIYDPSFAEVQRMSVVDGGFLSGAALQFLLGRGDMEREFDVRLVSCTASAVELELLPREPASYEKLRIVADPQTGNVSRTQIQDLLGNVTIVSFSEVEVNRDPPASLFHFDPPKGVRVIDLAAPKP
jgi:outer membrane lipoprotein carrier protein